ncbi:hypothetical protein CCH79_00018829, partial [Gambusia affinis]
VNKELPGRLRSLSESIRNTFREPGVFNAPFKANWVTILRLPEAAVMNCEHPAKEKALLSDSLLSPLPMALVTAARRLAQVSLREYSRRSSAVSRGAWQPSERSFTTGTQPLRSDSKVTVHFINRDGEKITVKASPGDSLLDVVINEDLDFDGFGRKTPPMNIDDVTASRRRDEGAGVWVSGACEGTLACSTCHLIFDEEMYKKLGPVTDEEMDMLDLAYGLTDTSRLGCQICLTKSLEGMVARVPESVADIRQTKDGSV